MSVSPTSIPTHTPPKEHSAVQALQTVLSCMTCFLPAYARADKAEQDRKGGGGEGDSCDRQQRRSTPQFACT